MTRFISIVALCVLAVVSRAPSGNTEHVRETRQVTLPPILQAPINVANDAARMAERVAQRVFNKMASHLPQIGGAQG